MTSIATTTTTTVLKKVPMKRTESCPALSLVSPKKKCHCLADRLFDSLTNLATEECCSRVHRRVQQQNVDAAVKPRKTIALLRKNGEPSISPSKSERQGTIAISEHLRPSSEGSGEVNNNASLADNHPNLVSSPIADQSPSSGSRTTEGMRRRTGIYARTHAEAESAAQRDFEEDDLSWYYRNPTRYVWRPRNSRTRMMQRRKRGVGAFIWTGSLGGADEDECLPTANNRALFATYLVRQYGLNAIPSLTLGLDGDDAEKTRNLEEEKKKTSKAVSIDRKPFSSSGVHIYVQQDGPLLDDLRLSSKTDVGSWEDDLFPSNTDDTITRHYRPDSYDKRASNSSLESYTCSDNSYTYNDSAPTSVRLSCDSITRPVLPTSSVRVDLEKKIFDKSYPNVAKLWTAVREYQYRHPLTILSCPSPLSSP